MLMSALRTLVKNPVKKNFNITSMRNEKSCQNINFFYFLIKFFFNWIFNQYSKGTRLHDPFIKTYLAHTLPIWEKWKFWANKEEWMFSHTVFIPFIKNLKQENEMDILKILFLFHYFKLSKQNNLTITFIFFLLLKSIQFFFICWWFIPSISL